jgi:hypothetical protein
MKRLRYLPAVLLPALLVAQPAVAEPAWGSNCLSCHGQLQWDMVHVFGEDTSADPDESGTGAPDRGTLQVFQTSCDAVKTLQTLLVGLDTDDTYAVQLKRLRFPGVETGGQLTYTGDCDWSEWGESASYYSDPTISYRWGTGPDTFAFDIDVGPDTDGDYYDLVFTVAGKFESTGELFYGEQHFYLQVVVLPGDLNCDGEVNLADLATLLGVFGACTGDSDYLLAADFDGDGCIDLDDLSLLLAYYGTKGPPEDGDP